MPTKVEQQQNRKLDEIQKSYIRFAHITFGALIGIVAILIVIAILSTYFYKQNSDRSKDNKNTLLAIQESRLESCEQTYNSFHAVFDPFLPPAKQRTAKQKHDIAKFNKVIAKKIKACKKQVTPPPVPTKKKK